MTTPFVNVGDILAGKYRVDRVLGMGGMGMVVAVTHLELEQRMALKFMRADAATSSASRDRFLREARAAVRLKGEHVCRVFDTGRLDGGEPYIAMELLEGEDFSRLLSRRAPLAISEAVDYVLQALEGVAEAHANGIVHRDLKPGNLFVATASDGSPLVKVLDFGISKSTSVAGAITQTGDVMGSPSYMAPEQMASAKDVDVRADIWALGVIVYQAVSRRLPYEQDSLPALCTALASEEPVPLSQRAKVPDELDAVVMRCLAKRRDDRPADVGELATLLAPLGGAGASRTAERIVKVLRRQKPPSQAPVAYDVTLDPSGATKATIDPAAATQATIDPKIAHVSTFQSSAAESLGSSVPPRPRRRVGLVLAATAMLGVGGVTIAIVGTQGGSTTHQVREPSAPSATTPDPVAPVPESPPPAAEGSAVIEAPVAVPEQKPRPRVTVKATTAPVDAGVSATTLPDAAPERAIFKGTKVPIKTTYPD